jgi:hypothetical protein
MTPNLTSQQTTGATACYAEQQPLLYSPANAARTLDISVRSVWRLIELGRLDVIRIAGSTRITAESLRRLATEGLSRKSLVPTG